MISISEIDYLSKNSTNKHIKEACRLSNEYLPQCYDSDFYMFEDDEKILRLLDCASERFLSRLIVAKVFSQECAVIIQIIFDNFTTELVENSECPQDIQNRVDIIRLRYTKFRVNAFDALITELQVTKKVQGEGGDMLLC